MKVRCEPFLIFSDFDSGNALTAESVQRNASSLHQAEYELNIYTKPDCHGTIYQNGNRTWFHFGIEGGKPDSIVKLNILNLNKQVKLFSQGMQPVFRYLPEKPEWERIRDKLIINERENHVCSITFNVRLPPSTNSAVFVAFTYPFSYLDLCEYLSTVDNIYSRTKLEGFPFHINCNLSPKPSRAELSLLQTARSESNQIYYHRECVIYSLEGRRVELVTITSCQGMSEIREERLTNLFPVLSEERPHKFPGKKVIFLSARVHPGETPSSFVLNGVYKFLLQPIDPRAIALRRFFVFKFILMLNPDGVARGHYRTDPRGINLNRVYLQPSIKLHPSIYAARKLLLYYHHGMEIPDDYDCESQCEAIPSTSSSMSGQKLQSTSQESELNRSSELNVETGSDSDNKTIPTTFPMDMKEAHLSDGSQDVIMNKDTSIRCAGVSVRVYEENAESTFEACDEDSLVYVSDLKRSQTSTTSSESRFPTPERQPEHGLLSSLKKKDKTVSRKRSNKTFSKHSRHRNLSGGEDSGLFCYIDFHGHATRRGIFMYGNHFSDAIPQAECMLLPKLMSLNFQHFDFAACNFTERLMNMRDRQTGASREGSGRVAIYKLTGLIRSYTLECNYNTGRIVNNVINRGPTCAQDSVRFSSQPPKFTPQIFEDAGKALAESLLDLIGRNPWSRIGASEFRSIDGLRKWLLKRVHNLPEFKSLDSSYPPKKVPVVPLVPKKDNQNSNLQTPRPGSSKTFTKNFQLDKPTTSAGAKKKSKVPIIPNTESKSGLLQVFKVTKRSKTKPTKKHLTK